MPLDLFPYQLDGARFLASKLRAGVFDDPGVGKTAQAIRALDLVRARRCVIVCPAAVREVWVGEFRKFGKLPRKILKGTDIQHLNLFLRGRVDVLLLSYQMMAKWAKRMEGDVIDAMVFDECFPAETLVETESGPVSIGRIVHETLPVRVWCQGPNGLELRSVTRYIKSKPAYDLLQVDHEHGTLICTANHKVFVEGKGYIRADAIQPEDRLRVVRQAGHDDILASAFLQPVVFREIQVPSSRPGKDETDASRTEGNSTTGRVGTDATFEFRSGVSRQGGQHIEVAERQELDRPKGRKRLYNRAATYTVCGARLARRADGSHDPDSTSARSLQKLAEQLQSRLGAPNAEISDRGGRSESSDLEMEVLGRAQDHRIKRSRVVGVSVYESRGETGREVYNLEVAEHHNYFADGVLVGNCHYLKNRQTAWTRAALGAECDGKHGLARWAANVWFLTGTPNPNDAADIWSVMRFCKATPCSHRIFTDRYFKKRVGTYSTSHTVREEMVPELKLAIQSFSVRRTKKQAGLQLPPIWLTTINVDGDSAPVKALLRDHPGLEKAIVEAVEKGGLSFLDAAHIATLRRLVGTAKAPAFVELLKEELNDGLERVVVFAAHRGPLDDIRRGLQDAGFGVVTFDGGTSERDRQNAVARFQSDPSCRVFLGNIKAAGQGLTLTAASDVIMFESDWTPAGNAQALMRVHRIGQDKHVHARFVVLSNSIDEYVSEVVARKTRDLLKLGTFSEVAA